MRSNVIYFPYIRVPQSSWFTRLLLYWDRVANIVPSEYVQQPEDLGEYTRSLIEHQLVTQVLPKSYVHSCSGFGSAFDAYLNEIPERLAARREAFLRGETDRIHMEKMGPIEGVLVEAGVAKDAGYPWFDVERQTGADFMAYLAAFLGNLEEIDASPVTDSESDLSRLAAPGNNGGLLHQRLDPLRSLVLDAVFPAPASPVSPQKLAAFRDRRGDLLPDFRRHVERELVALAALKDPALQQRRLEILADEFRDTVDLIRARMEEDALGPIVSPKMRAIFLAIPGVPEAAGLLNAIFEAFSGGRKERRPPDLAYAAYAGEEL